MSLTNVMAEIAEFVAERPDLSYTLAIGSDSQVRNWKGKSLTNFVTAIVIPVSYTHLTLPTILLV